MFKMRFLVAGLVAVAIGAIPVIAYAQSYRCGDRECDYPGGCEWKDVAWPWSNQCVSVIPTSDKECLQTPESGWTCDASTYDPPAKCATVYINYVGALGGSDECTGANCGTEEESSTLGHLLQSCSDSYSS